MEIPEVLEDLEYPKVSESNIYDNQPNLPVSAVLDQLGIINNSMKSITEEPQSVRESKSVIQTPYRNQHKVSILYVAKNKREQIDILKGDIISEEFASFIKHFGFPVDLPTHCSTNGGLDLKTFSNGYTSLFYANNIHEVMFHLPLFLAKANNDENFIYKKRHIGNDSVHVIWCEDSEEYNKTTIISHFNHAHIVVYPLGNKMFSVQVFSKPEVPWFGPIRGKTILSEKSLIGLVRSTTINADQVCNTTKADPQSSYTRIKSTHLEDKAFSSSIIFSSKNLLQKK